MKQSETTTVTKTHCIKLTNGQLGIEILLLGTAVFVVYLFLALFSFNATDPSWSQTSISKSVHNWGGVMGAYFADFLLQMFGMVAYFIPFVLLALCIQLVHYFYYRYGKPINYFTASLRVIGLLTFLFSFTGFFALNINDWPYYKAGGILGELIADEIYSIFSQIGSSLLFLSLGMISVTLLTGYSWLFFAEKLGSTIVFVTWPVLNFINGYWNRRKSTLKKSTLFMRIFYVPLSFFRSRKLTDEVRESFHEIDSDEIGNGLHNVHPNKTEISENLEQDNLNEAQTLVEEPYFDPYYQDNTIDNEPEPIASTTHSDINSDYYSPIKDKRQETPKSDQHSRSSTRTYLPEPVRERGSHSREGVPFVAQKKLAASTMVTLDHNTIHDSTIHPFLMKHSVPVAVPDTPLPCYDLLTQPPVQQTDVDFAALESMARRIEKSLADFRVKARVVDYRPGPVVTLYEIELAAGIKASRISTLDRDLARSLSMSSVRVVEVIPGKPYVGLELPNEYRETVYFREVLDTPQFHDANSPLTIVLGKDIGGVPVVADIAKTPHLLVAGTTGSGKSVGVNAMILSILYKASPEEVRFIMIDPKMLELSIYEGIPHLLTEVVTDMKDASNALNWCINEMERRYRLMSVLGVRNLTSYNEKIQLAQELGRPIPDPLWKPNENQGSEMPVLEKLPYIVVMVDEFADLIMSVGKKVEELIARLAQKARAAGIHLVLATQRPSVDVITGLIKANIPTRIAFTVSSKIDSRTILDQSGAESLLGMGDMLYLAPNSSIPIRVHGAFVRDEEVHAVVQDWKARGKPEYIDNITAGADTDNDGFTQFDEELDPLFDQVVSFVVEKRRASISSVQRQFRIGYNRAARIVDQMEMQGIVSPPSHNGNREVIAPPTQAGF